MIFTSIIKNNTRNIEKNIEKLNTEILKLNKELFNAEMDYIYLSSPDKLEKNISIFNKKKLLIKEDRIYLLFFIFFCLISIFSIKIIFTSLNAITLKKNYPNL